MDEPDIEILTCGQCGRAMAIIEAVAHHLDLDNKIDKLSDDNHAPWSDDPESDHEGGCHCGKNCDRGSYDPCLLPAESD